MARATHAMLALLLAGSAAGQSSLEADLDRARDRHQPAATKGTAGVDRLTAEAGEHLRAGRTDRAVAVLDRAAGLAYQSGATGRAFELALAAAEAQRSAREWLGAARRFRDAALTNPRDPRAATAHHTACETFARALATADEAELNEYDTLLAQHAATWPAASTAEATRWERVELLSRLGRYDEQVELARRVSPDDERRARAEQLLLSVHSRWLRRDPSAKRFASARADLEGLFLYAPTPWPAEWSELQREAAYTLARGALAQGESGWEYAKRVLRVALRNRPAPPPDWRRRAAVLLSIASMAANDRGAATEALAIAGGVSPATRQRLYASTAPRVRAVRDRKRLADEADRLEKTLALLAGQQPADGADKAVALLAAGRQAEALKLYEELADQRPHDRDVQVAYAKLLNEGDGSAQETALAIWRRLEARSGRSTPAWFEARLGRLRMLVRLGRRDEAAKLLELTRLLTPSLGGAESAAGFEAVGQSLRAAD